jgi:hypothetical protein
MVGVRGRRTVVVSSGPSAAGAGGEPSKIVPPATDAVVRKRRRVCMIGIEILPFLSVHAFSSRLSSLKKRQSVPSAMIFCGLDLIMPASCSRRA